MIDLLLNRFPVTGPLLVVLAGVVLGLVVRL